MLLITAWSISYMYDNEDEFMHSIIPFFFSLLHQKLLFMHNIQCSITVLKERKEQDILSYKKDTVKQINEWMLERNTHSKISFLTFQ